MATERVLILPETSYGQDSAATNKGLIVDILINGTYSNLSKKLFAPKDAVSISSVRVNYVRKYIGNAYLRFGITQVPQASGGAPVTQTGTYAAYASALNDGKVVSVDVPAAVFSGIALAANDRLGLFIERDAANALDTYEADFEIESVEFFFDTVSTATTTERVLVLPETAYSQDAAAANKGLVVDTLVNGIYSNVVKKLFASSGALSISSLNVNYVRKHAGDVYLRFGMTHVPQVSGSAPATVTGSYGAYPGGGTDGKVVSIAVPAAVYNTFSLSANDRLGLVIERDAANALDTYEADFEIESVEFFFEITLIAAALVTLSEIKNYLKIAATDTSKDSLLQGWIIDVSRSIETYCKNKIKKQQVLNELHNGDGTSELWTMFSPITDIYGATDTDKLASVQYRTSPKNAWTNITTDVLNFLIDPIDGNFLELYDTVFPEGRSNIKISYYAGYDPVPSDIKLVCLEMAAMMWKESNAGESRLGLQSQSASESGGNFNTTFKDLKPEWKLILHQYARLTSMPISFRR